MNASIDADNVKAAAHGKWPDILHNLAGLDHGQLRNKHQPCPACGGTDRYRFDDKTGDGEHYCNQCEPGDGLSLLRKVTGWDFPTALQRVSEYLGITEGTTPSPEETARHKERQRKTHERQEKEDTEKRKQAAKLANAIWLESTPATQNTPRLARKGLKPAGTIRQIEATDASKILGYELFSKHQRLKGILSVYPITIDEALSSIEFQDEAGRKSAITGGTKKSGYWATQRLPDGAGEGLTIAITEGATTAQRIFEALAYIGIAALTCSNLPAVAALFKKRYPKAAIIVCGDEGNGQEHAEKAASQNKCFLAIPHFTDEQIEQYRQQHEKQPTDFDDLYQLAGIDALKKQITEKTVQAPASFFENIFACNNGKDDDDKRESQATRLVGFVEERAELFHDQNGTVYATVKDTGETKRIESRGFRDWLASAFFEINKVAAREASIRESLTTLAGIGRQRGEQREAHTRLARHDGRYYLDLAEPRTSRAVEIDEHGWRIVERPPVRFIRPESMRELPTPLTGGDINTLWEVTNIPSRWRLLVLAWLVECLRPETVFPILELIGEQGTAKSSTQTALRRLIDPNHADLRAAPKSGEDVFIAANAAWIVSFENVSYLASPIQDVCCSVSTGSGYAKRKLYSDVEESVIHVKRPIMINGISASVTNQDMVQRTISIELQPITERKEEQEVLARYDALHPVLVGALLTIFSKALSKMREVHIPGNKLPRLADFAKLGVSVALATGQPPEAFWDAFNAANLESVERTIEGNPVASAVMEWIETCHGRQQLPAKEIYKRLERFKGNDLSAWPKTPKGLGDALRRIAPALRSLGIHCQCLGKQSGNVLWVIEKKSDIKEHLEPLPRPRSPEVLNSPTIAAPDLGHQDIADMITGPDINVIRRNGREMITL